MTVKRIKKKYKDKDSTKWQLIAQPELPGVGHRYFRKNLTGEIYVADNSGDSPDDTDDGPLRVLTNIPISVSIQEKSMSCRISVIEEDVDTVCMVDMTCKEALYLIENMSFTIELYNPEDCLKNTNYLLLQYALGKTVNKEKERE